MGLLTYSDEEGTGGFLPVEEWSWSRVRSLPGFDGLTTEAPQHLFRKEDERPETTERVEVPKQICYHDVTDIYPYVLKTRMQHLHRHANTKTWDYVPVATNKEHWLAPDALLSWQKQRTKATKSLKFTRCTTFRRFPIFPILTITHH